ncbi:MULTISPECIES: hypothetical protein [Bacillales]|uniref:hypothetical protein n=1 Tax=Bacillales TaxID=1385 RepID=UPI00188426F9|nr:hypothetical protein [Pseudalkalibacillus hwajinpoensis]MBF0709015.1 hypothetical protein [Pseudalkalibacillus hwajinpoensis]WLR60291.1 hypothetical protein LC071_02620 [Pseudalkalibacillus hwajinpoensis]
MKRLATKAVLWTCLVTLLSGCLYPESQKNENQIPYTDQIQSVQTAVEQFQENKSILPIKTRDQETPIYQKYPVDFKKLVPAFLQQAPGNSFESGGVFQYVLIHVEEEPTVRLIDLVTIEKVKDLQLRINDYRRKKNYPPFKDVLAKDRYSIDYDAMGMDEEPTVKSPFTNEQLPFFLDEKGDVHINYSSDLTKAIESNPDHSYEKGDDIRDLLADNSFYVPVASVAYTIENDKAVFLVK